MAANLFFQGNQLTLSLNGHQLSQAMTDMLELVHFFL
jgi:hypothetical protein